MRSVALASLVVASVTLSATGCGGGESGPDADETTTEVGPATAPTTALAPRPPERRRNPDWKPPDEPVAQRRSGKAKPFARATRTGDYASVTASGEVEHPKAIDVAVAADPDQQVSLRWLTTCTERGDDGHARAVKTEGHVVATTPIRRRLGLRPQHPLGCFVAAYAQLDDGGTITVEVRG